jgi:hypothetical protein
LPDALQNNPFERALICVKWDLASQGAFGGSFLDNLRGRTAYLCSNRQTFVLQ